MDLTNHKLTDKLYGILGAMLLAFFLPVLFCVVFIGMHMDYTDDMKINTRLPNQVLLLIALAGIAVCIFLFRKFSGAVMTKLQNRVCGGVLAVLFLGLYFLNIWAAKEIIFYLPWDIMVVRYVAYEIANRRALGYHYYFSMYHNNLPITYILGRLCRKAMELRNYPYYCDFIWIQVNCALISAAGFFSCLTVKKLTRKIMPVALAFSLYLVLAGISPWKIAPYTDTYGMVFPVMCVYFYVSARMAEKAWSRWLCVLLSITAGMTGGFIKPSLYIVIIALLGAEFLGFLKDHKNKWAVFLVEILLVLALAVGNRVYLDHIIEDIGLDYNEEIEAGWQHYFCMGLNENSTGGYNMDDVAMFGQYQTSKSERHQAELERAAERLRDRGVIGTAYFYLRKMVMTFNDGLFGWRTEVWRDEDYPVDMTSDTKAAKKLREIVWGNELGYDVAGYNTLCQLAWIFAILGIPGICLCRGNQREKHGIFIITFLGIFFYQMLFEARARYLFVFLPVILVMSVCGIAQYESAAGSRVKK